MSWKKLAYLSEVATLSNNVPQAVTVGATGSAGSGAAASKDDHVHGSPATWPPSAHTLDSHSELKLDTLDEKTATVGVTVDGCLVKDGLVADSNKLEGSTKAQVQDHTPKAHTLASHSELKLDTLDEVTLNTGVTIDTCLIKDGKAADSNLLEGSNKATVQDHTPKAHTLNSHTAATGAVDFGKQEATTLVLQTATGAPGTPVDGQIYFEDADDHVYIYVAA